MGAARVLIIDGDSSNRLIYQEAVKFAGFDVETAGNARKVHDLLKSSKPDLIVLSAELPKINSFELCRLIKSGKFISPVPVLMITESKAASLSARWPSLGNMIDGLLIKPFSPQRLVDEVGAMLHMDLKKVGSGPAKPDENKEQAPILSRGMLDTIQGELEKKALIIAESKAKIKDLEARLNKVSSGTMTRDEYLKTKVRDLELELAAKNLNLTEMEVKIEELIRLKTDFESRAQDIIEQKTADERSLRKNYQNLLKTKENLQQEMNSLKRYLEKTVIEKERLEEKLHAEAEDGDKSAMSADITRLEELCAAKDGELGEQKERIVELEEALTSRKGAGEDITRLEELCAAKDGELEEQEKRIVELEEALTSRKGAGEDITRLEELCAAKDGELGEQEKRIVELEEALTSRKGAGEDITRLEELCAAKDGELGEQKKRIVELEEALTSKKGADEDITRLEELCAAKDGELGEQKERIVELEEALTSKKGADEDITRLEELCARKDSELDELTAKKNELEETLAGKEEEVKALSASLDRKEVVLQEKVAYFQERLQQLGEVNEKLAENLQDQPSREEFDAIIKEFEALKEEKDAFEKAAEENQGKIDSLSTDLEESRYANQELREQLSSLEEERHKLEEHAAETAASIEEAEKERDGLQLCLEELTAAEGESARNHDEMVRQLEEDKVEQGKLQARIDELLSDLKERENDIENRDEDISNLKDNIKLIENDLASEKGTRKTVEDEYRLRIESIEKEKDDLKKQVEEMPARLEAMNSSEMKKAEKMQENFMEAVRVAQRELMEKTSEQADLEARLESLKREKDEIARRYKEENQRSIQREKRLEELLEQAIYFGGENARAFLPAKIIPTRFPWRRRIRRWSMIGSMALILIFAGAGAYHFFGMIGKPSTGNTQKGIEMAARPKPEETIAPPQNLPRPEPPVVEQKGTWEIWTRRTTSGGVMLQATLRSEEELRASLEAEFLGGGSDSSKLEREWQSQRSLYDFDSYYYFYIFTKNLEPGYPSYADDLHKHLFLRDGTGREVEGQMPRDMTNGKVIYTHAMTLAKDNTEFLYEVAAWVVFPKKELSGNPKFLQLTAYDIGATSRRVLTWEFVGNEE